MTRFGNGDAGSWGHGSSTCVELSIDGRVALLRLNRSESGNSISARMVAELWEALDEAEARCSVLVLEGGHEVFCVGADLSEYSGLEEAPDDPGALYRLWVRMATGPLLTVAHVRGRVMAGGVGFVAASDIAICGLEATFALSELLFGLYPAMVLPFLIRRIGRQHAHYLTCITQPIGAQQAEQWGLVDEATSDTRRALSRCLSRLTRVPIEAIQTYKDYLNEVTGPICAHEARAVRANREMFLEPSNLRRISDFTTLGLMPWERELAGARAGLGRAEP